MPVCLEVQYVGTVLGEHTLSSDAFPQLLRILGLCLVGLEVVYMYITMGLTLADRLLIK